MYRPPGYTNPFSDTGFEEELNIFEAGADAIVEALRGKGHPVKNGDNINFPPTRDVGQVKVCMTDGVMVFIPDEA